ncbi:cbb3-type cytochrome oxidase assembly protein CcoS [Bradyrhizobium macuxiense]|uniref:cbb3-type cytochrome oxidase assembly protein CcoS n=1 Tax=Bradyrhizobium macuxiense TaxID=1755647 RepID=UPI0032221A98
MKLRRIHRATSILWSLTSGQYDDLDGAAMACRRRRRARTRSISIQIVKMNRYDRGPDRQRFVGERQGGRPVGAASV